MKMENQNTSASHEKQILSSTQPLFPSSPTFPTESTPSAPSAPHSDPSQFHPYSGMPYLQCYPPPISDMSYSQPSVSPPAGPFYPQPKVDDPKPPPVSKYPTANPQQEEQRQQLILRNSIPTRTTPIVFESREPVWMLPALVVSATVCCVCLSVCGLIALILASKSQLNPAHLSKNAGISCVTTAYVKHQFNLTKWRLFLFCI